MNFFKSKVVILTLTWFRLAALTSHWNETSAGPPETWRLAENLRLPRKATSPRKNCAVIEPVRKCIKAGKKGCLCPKGYSKNARNECIDKDECYDFPCGGMVCQNVPGSYQCSCYYGQAMDKNGQCIRSILLNVATGTNFICEGGEVEGLQLLGDRIINPQMFRVLTPCAVLKVPLVSAQVSYVVIHPPLGRQSEDKIVAAWGAFMVNLEFRKSETYHCGYHERRTMYKKGLRVNCMSWHPLLFSLMFFNVPNECVSATEIEVISIGESRKHQGGVVHRGCYKTFTSIRTVEDSVLEMCIDFCSGYNYVGIKIDVCVCGSEKSFHEEVSASLCDKKCSDQSVLPCGGLNLYSVYLVSVQLPHSQGCRLQPISCAVHNCFNHKDMTVGRCIQFCERYKFASLRGGDKCACTDKHSATSSRPERCNVVCGGDRSTNCGGTHYSSIYGTCLISPNGSTCMEMIKCTGRIDDYGACLDSCKDGFEGEFCLHKRYDYRIEKIKNTTKTKARSEPDICKRSNPCAKDPNTNCKSISAKTYECVCQKGYTRQPPKEQCRKISTLEMRHVSQSSRLISTEFFGISLSPGFLCLVHGLATALGDSINA